MLIAALAWVHEPERSGREEAEPSAPVEQPDPVATRAEAVAGALAYPTGFLRDRVDFMNDATEWRRLFAELLGTFFLVLVAVGGDMVNAKFGGHVIGPAARVTAPGLMVGAIILFMGSVSGAHLNPGVSLAFALRGDFPWRRVPGYVVAQFAGACLATLLLVALIGAQGTAGLTLPGPSITPMTAMLWEMVLTVGLVSVILGTSSGAQNVGALNAPAVAGYIALAGLWGAPISGASMNLARSLGPALVLVHGEAWWAYLVGPIAGAVISVGIARVLRGRGGGFYGKMAAQGGLGWLWSPGPITRRVPSSPEELARKAP
jgi:aquaporin Z